MMEYHDKKPELQYLGKLNIIRLKFSSNQRFSENIYNSTGRREIWYKKIIIIEIITTHDIRLLLSLL